MARRVGPVKVRRYSLEFKLKAVKLSQLKGVEVQALDYRSPVDYEHGAAYNFTCLLNRGKIPTTRIVSGRG